MTTAIETGIGARIETRVQTGMPTWRYPWRLVRYAPWLYCWLWPSRPCICSPRWRQGSLRASSSMR